MSKKHRKHKKISKVVRVARSESLPKIEASLDTAPPERKVSLGPEINHSTVKEIKSIMLIVGFLLVLTVVIVVISNRTNYLNELSDSIIRLLNIQ